MSTIKQIFDAETGNSRDGCDPDWCHEILQKANPKDLQKVERLLAKYPQSEAATILDIMD